MVYVSFVFRLLRFSGENFNAYRYIRNNVFVLNDAIYFSAVVSLYATSNCVFFTYYCAFSAVNCRYWTESYVIS